ncbi:hypothetical protein J2S74_001058 [Evansella vedderi]|uniref:Uncharacterized protein n=1 Tax=Evansella vedderi TaxID=38282 RepID=A0ABT9ZR23_9BACI|nr:hypothetical protein [Evansella vedderi]MDQ0253686.1 hypothetical protein [Evansella vedderi]
MSGLKSIELQVALPRTQTAGKLQDQIQQRGTVSQDHLAQKNTEDQLRKKATVNKMEQGEKPRINKDDNRGKGIKKQQRKKRNSQTEETEEQFKKELHPYKGKNFDVKW